MAKLSTQARNSLPKSDFLGPGRSFPAPDAEHARKAIQLAPRSEHAGNISASEEKAIVAKAKARLRAFKASDHSSFNSHGMKHEYSHHG
jgi:hypothetical protein